MKIDTGSSGLRAIKMKEGQGEGKKASSVYKL